MQFRVLGPLEAATDETVLALGGQKQRSVLGLLLLSANRVVSVDRLIEEVWPDEQPEKPASTLQVYVHNLRKLLEPERSAGSAPSVLTTERPGYLLRVDASQLDALQFEQLLELARAAVQDGERAVGARRFREALALWRGPVLADLAGESWVLGEARRLDELRESAIEERVDVELELGMHSELIAELESLVSDQGMREQRHGQLMLALYRSGRQAEALQAFQRAREVLLDELGIDPGPALRQLEQDILEQSPALDLPEAGDRGRPRSGVAAPPALPVERTALVGRDRDVEAIVETLRDRRLVTITGIAGSGKTRLALETAHAAAGEFADGVVFADLTTVTDPIEVPATVASAIATACGTSAEDGIDGVTDRSLLLVLDNCEQVLDACSTLVAGLNERAPGLRVLATSRQALGVDHEQVWPLDPLGTPAADGPLDPDTLLEYDAVRLFVYRARSALPDFELNADNAAAVNEIVRRLDGLPLAIVLAAARIRALGPAELAARLDDRFRILTADASHSQARHQTLWAAIDWSFELLNDDEQQALLRLAAFTGTFGLDAAIAVGASDGGDGIDTFFRLIDRSLVSVERNGASTRYRLLESIQAYARERLIGSPLALDTRERHAEWFVELVEKAEPLLRGPDADRWVEQLEREHDNVRAALEWSLDSGNGDRALRTARGMSVFWLRRGYIREGQVWIERALAATDPLATPLRASALLALAALALEADDTRSARRAAEQSRAASEERGDLRGVAYSDCVLGTVARRDGATDEARDLAQRALSIFKQLDDAAGTAAVLRDLGLVEMIEGDLDLARELLEEGLETIDGLRSTASGATLLQASLAPRGRSQILADLGRVAGLSGDLTRATRLVVESIGVAAASANLIGVSEGADALAVIAAEAGDPGTAAVFLSAAARLRSHAEDGAHASGGGDSRLRITLATRLGPERFAEATRLGGTLSFEQVQRLAERFALDTAEPS